MCFKKYKRPRRASLLPIIYFMGNQPFVVSQFSRVLGILNWFRKGMQKFKIKLTEKNPQNCISLIKFYTDGHLWALKAPFIFPHHNQTKSYIKLKPTYVEAQGPHCFGKVSFVTFRTADTENIGDIHRVFKAVFYLSSYILVLRFDRYAKS